MKSQLKRQKNIHEQNSALLKLTAAILVTNTIFIVPAYSTRSTSVLTKPQLSQAKKGNSYARSNKADKAQVAYQSAIDQATSVEQCLALVKSTEHFGSIMVPVRRNCLNKALHIAKTQEEFFQIIACARECQLYEITKEAIDALIAQASSKEDLTALAHKAQSMAMNDIAHMALDKLYVQEESCDDKITFAKLAKLMAMEDLMRKAIKDAMDQENGVHTLCHLISAIDPLEQQDLQRKILRKAVFQVTNAADCKEVFDMAKRLGQQDIVDLAAYKGRKYILMDQAKSEQEALNDEAAAARKEAESQANQTPASTTPGAPTGPGF